MTDTNSASGSTSVPPVPPTSAPGYAPQPTPTPESGYSGYAQPSYAAAPTAAPKTLSLIGMIAGIIGVLAFGWFCPASIAALILGYMGKSREGAPAKGFWLTAIITGWVGVAFTILGGIGFIALFVLGGAASTSGY